MLMLVFFDLAAFSGLVPQTVQIQQVSSSKKSMMIDQGQLQGVELGMRAVFIKAASPSTFHKEVIGLAQAVKVTESQSIWYFTKTVSFDYLVTGEFIEILTERDHLRGRVAPQVTRYQRVLLPQSKNLEPIEATKENTAVHLSGRDRRIIKQDGEYSEMKILLDPNNAIEQGHHRSIVEWAEWAYQDGAETEVLMARPLPVKPAKETEQIRQSIQDQRQFEIMWHLVRRSWADQEY